MKTLGTALLLLLLAGAASAQLPPTTDPLFDLPFKARQYLKTTATVCPSYTGTGSPEGVKTAIVCSTFQRTDGGVNSTMYVKETGTGNTGWKPMLSIAGGCLLLTGSGTPEAVAVAPVCSLYIDTAAQGSVYQKASGTGNTGWKSLARASSGTALPGTCTVGEIFTDTDAPALCSCTAADTWKCVTTS